MRSNTAAATVFASDSPPITRPSAPMPTSSAEKNAVEERSSRLSSLGSCTLTPDTRSAMRGRHRVGILAVAASRPRRRC